MPEDPLRGVLHLHSSPLFGPRRLDATPHPERVVGRFAALRRWGRRPGVRLVTATSGCQFETSTTTAPSAQRTSDLYLSVATIGEVKRGIEQQQHRDPAFADELARWLDRVLA